MAYFDSSKNRMLWEIELQDLRKARADRQAGKTSGEVKKETTKEMTGRKPVKMTYAELLKEEAQASKKAARRERPMKPKEHQMQDEMQKQEQKQKGRSL